MFNAVLLTAAGVVILAGALASHVLAWRTANKPTQTSVRPTLALSAGVAVNPVAYVGERDWLAPAANVNVPMLRPDYEGLYDDADADTYIADLRRAGYHIARAQTSIERAQTRQANEEFERFDRIMTGMVERMWATNRATLTRWSADWEQWKLDHPSETVAAELDETHRWIEREKGAVTQEFERIMMAEALLVS